ncbi:hypothetical protein HH214_09950 [Mucilaginibacter robiniae]|uniref:SbsA Ig-like domain-containing protein n=1 Tax=Mucilaginibacter robiniae TaxID=2728022 RepID=A0A7L5E0Y1_9SPHI|nr:Ig-like domain-containing protein [Mucilaginibacter robiniae]QJD96168.1 hypothetical protein HH214_09950 [Mucilaginibacter robiniae]
MSLKSRHLFLAYFSSILLLAVAGCASMQRPQGGPRDRNPPKLLKATPENMTRRFNARQVIFEFDEYFKLANTYQEISVSPAFEKQPEYLTKGRNLVINFKDSLQKNTTYVINFGKAIADVHEGNVLKNFTYVFSTGDHIDSLSITGSVTNTETLEKEKDATVMLFPASQDSALFGKKKPNIFTTTDSSGNFSLNNLHTGTYTIYALKEAAPDKIYNSENEQIAFLKKPIKLESDVKDVNLTLFKQPAQKFRIASKKFDNDGKLDIIFNKRLTDPSIKILYPPALDNQKFVDFSKTKDTALVYFKNMEFDSVSVAILDQNKPLDTVYQRKGLKETFKRNLGLGYNINIDNHLRPYTDLELTANFPLENMDASKIKLLEDSIPVNPLNLIKNPANPKKYTLKHTWKQNAAYLLVISEEALTDIYGDKNKELNKRFTIDKIENYGTLTLKVTVPDTAIQYLVELVDSKKATIRTDIISKSTSVVYKNLFTGKYQVKVTYDDNRNGKADGGNVKAKIYPEKIWISDKVLTLRPNWDQEEAVAIPKEPATP